MSTLVKQGTFTLNSSIGNQTISGVGFQPKLVIFWALQQATVAGATEVRRCWGAATSSTARWVGLSSVNPWNNFHSRRVMTNKVLRWNDAAGDTAIMEADFVAFTSDGFTISVSQGVSVNINYLAIGGSSFSAKVGSFDTDGTAEGTSQSITGVGFQPKAVMVINGPQTTSGTVVEDADGGEGLNFGFAVSSSSQEANSHWCKFDGGTVAKASCTNGSLITLLGYEALGYDMKSHLTSMDSTGFTLFHDVKWTGSTVRNLYIAFGGTAAYGVGSFNEPSSTGSATVSTGFRPAVELFMSTGGQNSAGSINTNSRFSFGAAVNSSQAGSIASFQPEIMGSATANSGVTSTTQAITRRTNTIDSAASLTGQNASGFSLDWTAVSGATTRYTYLAIGDPATSAAKNMFMCFN